MKKLLFKKRHMIPKREYTIGTFDPMRGVGFVAFGLMLLAIGIRYFTYMIRSHNLMNNPIGLVFFAFACIGFPSLILLDGVLSFYAPRGIQRLVRKIAFVMNRRLQNSQDMRAGLGTKRRFVLFVCAVVQGGAVGAVGVCVPIFLVAAVGLFAPPYAGPIPPVTALQKAHSEATQLWQAMASRPVSYVVLVGVLIGSWVAIRMCRRVRKRITGDASIFTGLRHVTSKTR